MPPPSNRCGLKCSVPLVIVPSRCCKAHPCVCPDLGQIVVFIVVPSSGRVTDATVFGNSLYVRARVARQSGNPSNPSLARIAQSSR